MKICPCSCPIIQPGLTLFRSRGKETSLILGIEHEDNQWDGVNLEYEKADSAVYAGD